MDLRTVGCFILSAVISFVPVASYPFQARLAWLSPEFDNTFSIAWGDYENDGLLDLAGGNDFPNRVYENLQAAEHQKRVHKLKRL